MAMSASFRKKAPKPMRQLVEVSGKVPAIRQAVMQLDDRIARATLVIPRVYPVNVDASPRHVVRADRRADSRDRTRGASPVPSRRDSHLGIIPVPSV